MQVAELSCKHLCDRCVAHVQVDVCKMAMARDTTPLFLDGRKLPITFRSEDHADLVHLDSNVVLHQRAHYANPDYASHMDAYNKDSNSPVETAFVDLRVPHASPASSLPTIDFISVKLRKDHNLEVQKELIGYQEKAWPALRDEGVSRIPNFQPVVGLITTGRLNETAFADIAAGRLISRRPEQGRNQGAWVQNTPAADRTDARMFVLSADACAIFMPVLQHRPMLRDALREKHPNDDEFDSGEVQRVCKSLGVLSTA